MLNFFMDVNVFTIKLILTKWGWDKNQYIYIRICWILIQVFTGHKLRDYFYILIKWFIAKLIWIFSEFFTIELLMYKWCKQTCQHIFKVIVNVSFDRILFEGFGFYSY